VHASCKPPSFRKSLRRCFSVHQPCGSAGNLKESEEEKTLDLQRDGQTFQALDSNDSEAPGSNLSEPSDKQAGPMTVPFPSYTEGESQNWAIQQKMRRYMRRVPQSAVIVTATNINDSQNPSRGATVSSFTTVTFEPEVIVSLNLKLPSATFDAIKTSNWFDVKMLKPNHIGAAAASRFARGHAESPFGRTGKDVPIAATRSPKQLHQPAPPLVHEGHGIKNPVAFHLTCLYMREKSVHLGDHVVVFGIVKRIPERSDKHLEEESCLAYVDGCYGSVKPFSSQPDHKSDKLIVSPIVGKAGMCDNVIEGNERQKQKLEVQKSHDVFGALESRMRRDFANEPIASHEYTDRPTVNLPSSFVERPERSAANGKSYLPYGGASKSSINGDDSIMPTWPKMAAEYQSESTQSVQEADHENRNSTVAKFRAQSSPLASALVSTPMLPFAQVPIMPFWGFAITRRYSQSTKDMRYRENDRSSKNTAPKLLLATRSVMLPLSASSARRKYSAGSPAFDQSVIRGHVKNAGRKASSAVRVPEKQSSGEGGHPLNPSVCPIIRKIDSDSNYLQVATGNDANIWSFVQPESPKDLPVRKLALRDLVRYVPRDDIGIRKFVYDRPGPDSESQHETVDATNETIARIRKINTTNNVAPRRKLRTRKQRGYSPRDHYPLRDDQSLPSSPSRYKARLGEDNTATLTNDASALIDAILHGLDTRVSIRPSYPKAGKQLKHSHSSKETAQRPRPFVGEVIHKVPCGPQNENEVSLPQLATTEAMRRDIEDVKAQIQELFLKK
jgi:Flavin reductase like domain